MSLITNALPRCSFYATRLPLQFLRFFALAKCTRAWLTTFLYLFLLNRLAAVPGEGPSAVWQTIFTIVVITIVTRVGSSVRCRANWLDAWCNLWNAPRIDAFLDTFANLNKFGYRESMTSENRRAWCSTVFLGTIAVISGLWLIHVGHVATLQSM